MVLLIIQSGVFGEKKEKSTHYGKELIIEEKSKSEIVWLEQGSLSRGFKHILYRHSDEFATEFSILDHPLTIGNFIFNAITEYPIHNTVTGGGGQSKFYIYEIRRGGTTNYLHILVDEEGSIITAYPSEYED